VARAFQRIGAHRFRASFTRGELDVLRDLPGQLRTVLDDAADPAAERLLPPAYTADEDAEANEDYRRLMQSELVDGKRAAVQVVIATLERVARRGTRWSVELSEEEALAWLGVLNDIRLTLGVRLDITDDLDGEVDPGDPRAPGLHLLYYLGWLEEHLVAALAGG
jgi:hypothetical protein